MKFVDEFRSGELAKKLAHELAALIESGHTRKIMEVCGGHTHTIYKHGMEEALPDGDRTSFTGRVARCA